ncbi:Acyl-CoA dehydrogenase/oxidase C-terminal [Syntrophomonas zehnderi OL-4]|uniref:Acyl-CoA dehydrogenase/oxidase C-terminal n=1 Tax=Syntrophomonas zehnderi OL-4 TaxID=690567 RepID=A0A0E4GBQ8_9FIRM|nr:acyl-CoA dehydrogenase family protein [Syntrophomonas zehnderi]CFW96038.1 Acyl-CoA dehydrogenase/oxidase C-terminal [Syntrophomonas zehnderi OL-4]
MNLLLNPKQYQDRHYPDERSKEIMLQTIQWFEEKGLAKQKEQYHNKQFAEDFQAFMTEEGFFETLFLPAGYGSDPHQYYSTYRMYEFSEICGFYGAAYWYCYHVSTLGLDPVLMGDNEEAKHLAAAKLKENAFCAFGLSEKEHGADIYATEMMLYPQDDGTYLANGSKYYIGNGNVASTISVFGKMADTGEYVFFVVDSAHPNYKLVKNIVDVNQQYVAEFELQDYPITKAEILTVGPKAWDDMLNTINVCKFNIGSGATGIVTHSFYEAINHAFHRHLYGQRVTDFPHVKRLFADAWLRIMGMKLFGLRATDYMRVASENDKRYLLYNPIMKMKVAIQGEKVHELLFDIIAAKGFEKDMYFEQAVTELTGFPKLEGTRHVNMALIAKLIPSYMFMPGEFEEVGKITDNRDDTFLFHQGRTRGYAQTKFHDYMIAYRRLAHLPNVQVYIEQIEAYKAYLALSGRELARQMTDFDYLLAVGELFTMVAYGQLIIESAQLEGVGDAVMNQLFDVFVRDFSAYAMELYGKPLNTEGQAEAIQKMFRRPIPNPEEFAKVLEEEVYSLADVYTQNP